VGWLFAKAYERMIGASEEACVRQWRAELLGGLQGDVLEVGAGTGLNLRHYPATLGRLVLAEPERHMRAALQAKLDAAPRSSVPVELVDAPAEALPFADESFDVVVTTLVLCSVPDQAQALAEIHRVLRPGGRLVYLEHVVADDKPKRHAWQRRVEPLWRRAMGGCHLTRDTVAAIRAAGFDATAHHRESMRKATALVRTCERGEAVKAARSGH
jgi:ubiquinone/menaquinone biosynthesis C-methylase UbiE